MDGIKYPEAFETWWKERQALPVFPKKKMAFADYQAGRTTARAEAAKAMCMIADQFKVRN